MGTRGPIPKRRKLGHTAKAAASGVTTAPVAGKVTAPRADGQWHPVARRWYQSLARSPQAELYQPSDWGTAWVLAESMSREFKAQPVTLGRGDGAVTELVELPPKAASLAAWLKGMSALLATEGDRRRAQLNLQRPSPRSSDGDEVAWFADAQRRLRGTDPV